jgi:DNA-binding MarR family transcriptional regulator
MDAGDQDTLSDADRAVWHAFKRATETVTTAVERDILAAAGLTGAEFGVLDRLALQDGTMRQSDLGRSMHWNKSRLSHQVTRMQERRLLTRSTLGAAMATVSITQQGLEALSLARPAHARAIRAHLTEPLTSEQQEAFRTALGCLTRAT